MEGSAFCDLEMFHFQSEEMGGSDRCKISKPLKAKKEKEPDLPECLEVCIWRRHNFNAALGYAILEYITDTGCELAIVLQSKSDCPKHKSNISQCKCGRKLFQSTKNSKRNCHLYAFWRRLLGSEFPITDDMTQRLKDLLKPLCEFGIKLNTCHAIRKEGVCVCMDHYEVVDEERVKDLLVEGLVELSSMDRFAEHVDAAVRSVAPRCNVRAPGALAEAVKSMKLNFIAEKICSQIKLCDIATEDELNAKPVQRQRHTNEQTDGSQHHKGGVSKARARDDGKLRRLCSKESIPCKEVQRDPKREAKREHAASTVTVPRGAPTVVSTARRISVSSDKDDDYHPPACLTPRRKGRRAHSSATIAIPTLSTDPQAPLVPEAEPVSEFSREMAIDFAGPQEQQQQQQQQQRPALDLAHLSKEMLQPMSGSFPGVPLVTASSSLSLSAEQLLDGFDAYVASLGEKDKQNQTQQQDQCALLSNLCDAFPMLSLPSSPVNSPQVSQPSMNPFRSMASPEPQYASSGMAGQDAFPTFDSSWALSASLPMSDSILDALANPSAGLDDGAMMRPGTPGSTRTLSPPPLWASLS